MIGQLNSKSHRSPQRSVLKRPSKPTTSKGKELSNDAAFRREKAGQIKTKLKKLLGDDSADSKSKSKTGKKLSSKEKLRVKFLERGLRENLELAKAKEQQANQEAESKANEATQKRSEAESKKSAADLQAGRADDDLARAKARAEELKSRAQMSGTEEALNRLTEAETELARAGVERAKAVKEKFKAGAGSSRAKAEAAKAKGKRSEAGQAQEKASKARTMLSQFSKMTSAEGSKGAREFPEWMKNIVAGNSSSTASAKGLPNSTGGSASDGRATTVGPDRSPQQQNPSTSALLQATRRAAASRSKIHNSYVKDVVGPQKRPSLGKRPDPRAKSGNLRPSRGVVGSQRRHKTAKPRSGWPPFLSQKMKDRIPTGFKHEMEALRREGKGEQADRAEVRAKAALFRAELNRVTAKGMLHKRRAAEASGYIVPTASPLKREQKLAILDGFDRLGSAFDGRLQPAELPTLFPTESGSAVTKLTHEAEREYDQPAKRWEDPRWEPPKKRIKTA